MQRPQPSALETQNWYSQRGTQAASKGIDLEERAQRGHETEALNYYHQALVYFDKALEMQFSEEERAQAQSLNEKILQNKKLVEIRIQTLKSKPVSVISKAPRSDPLPSVYSAPNVHSVRPVDQKEEKEVGAVSLFDRITNLLIKPPSSSVTADDWVEVKSTPASSNVSRSTPSFQHQQHQSMPPPARPTKSYSQKNVVGPSRKEPGSAVAPLKKSNSSKAAFQSWRALTRQCSERFWMLRWTKVLA